MLALFWPSPKTHARCGWRPASPSSDNDLKPLLSPKTRIGRVQLRVRRAFLASPNRELTTRELMEWTHSRRLYQGQDSHRERHNYCRAIRRAAERYAVRVGRVRPGGVVWRLAD